MATTEKERNEEAWKDDGKTVYDTAMEGNMNLEQASLICDYATSIGVTISRGSVIDAPLVSAMANVPELDLVAKASKGIEWIASNSHSANRAFLTILSTAEPFENERARWCERELAWLGYGILLALEREIEVAYEKDRDGDGTGPDGEDRRRADDDGGGDQEERKNSAGGA